MTGTAMKWLTQDSLSIIKTERQFDMKETTKRKLKRLHQKLNELEERMKKMQLINELFRSRFKTLKALKFLI